MGYKSKSDISNNAIRIFLQNVGEFYDKARGFSVFKVNSNEWKTVMDFFSNECCFCAKSLNETNTTVDHLIPINMVSLGLHCWGNVVPCCSQCNKEKHGQDWHDFLKSKSGNVVNFKDREERLKAYQRNFKYNPNLKIESIARNLYEDVGEISMKLIELRFKQAKEIIEKI